MPIITVEEHKKTYLVSRPVQRARVQDEYMDFYEEADPLPPGGIRLIPSSAPLIVKADTVHPVKALEEAPDGYRRLDWSGQALKTIHQIPGHFSNARIVMLNDNKLTEFPDQLSQVS